MGEVLLWSGAYVVSALVAMIAFAFMLGREGARRMAPEIAFILGAFWPLVLLCWGLFATLEFAVERGASSK